MATGRTPVKWMRIYMDGYPMSNFVSKIEQLSIEHEEVSAVALDDAVTGAFPGHTMISVGALNAMLENTASNGLHIVGSGAGVSRELLVAIGIRAEPAQGDPVFAYTLHQREYKAANAGGLAAVTIPFAGRDVLSDADYPVAWGQLLNAYQARTAVNTAIGIDDEGAATALGGFFVYQVFTSDGTVTIKAQDAATNTNPSFSDLSGATSGVIDPSSGPLSDRIALGTTAAVRQFLRWQIVLGTATTVTFACAFIRGR